MVHHRFQFLLALLVLLLLITHAGCIGVSGDVSPQGSGFLAPWPFRPPTEVIAQTAARNLVRSGLPGRLSPTRSKGGPKPAHIQSRRREEAPAERRSTTGADRGNHRAEP